MTTKRPTALDQMRSGSVKSGTGGRIQPQERHIDRALVNAIVDGTAKPTGTTLKDMDLEAEAKRWER